MPRKPAHQARWCGRSNSSLHNTFGNQVESSQCIHERIRCLPQNCNMRRTRVLVLAYASLLLIALASWQMERMYVGGIAVVPLLFIAYHSSRVVALTTAFAAGILLAVLDRDLLHSPESMNFPPALDIALLSATFCSTVVVAQALRHARWEAESDVLTRIPNR